MGRLNVSTKGYETELAILDRKGIVKTGKGIEHKFAEIMQDIGLDPRSTMAQLAFLMNSGESDAIKLAAVKFVTQLWMHPAVVQNRSADNDTRPQITFVVEGSNVQINNVLTPQEI